MNTDSLSTIGQDISNRTALIERFLQFLDIVIWPALVIVIIILFRRQITPLISRIEGATLPGGVKIDFQKEIEASKPLSEIVAKIKPQKEKEHIKKIPLTQANERMLFLGLNPSQSGLNLNYYRDLAYNDPNIALAGLRMEIEIMIKNLAKGSKVEVREREPTVRIIHKLLENDKITSEQNDLLLRILKICNAAVHGQIVSLDEALSVLDISESLRDQYLLWLSWGFDDGWVPE